MFGSGVLSSPVQAYGLLIRPGRSGALWSLSYAAFVAELNGGYEAGPVLVRCQEVPIIHPPFLDIGHDGMFPVDAAREDHFSLELLSRDWVSNVC